MPLREKLAANGIIVIFLGLILIDGLPTTCRAHGRLKAGIDAALDRMGLWQGSWQLFSPEPDRFNSRISARILLSDGSEVEWKSPEWQRMGIWEQFRLFRHGEFYDGLKQDENSAIWTSFSRYLAGETEREYPGRTVEAIRMTRHWVEISTPVAGQPLMAIGGNRDGEKSHEFSIWEAE